MPVDAFEKTGDPKDEGSSFLTEEEKEETKKGVVSETPKSTKKGK